ncbi:MAG: mechanosensitive ion channel [Bacteroidaceae bacterium]|nr:mechanosensitive ion channel [Bacteroidaceae bacterium]
MKKQTNSTKRKWLALVFAFMVCALPLGAIVSGRTLTNTLKDLYAGLQTVYRQRKVAQKRFNDDYERQHQRMIDVVKESNELSILLYTQEKEKTFNLAHALKKVTAEYRDFSSGRRPYDYIVGNLNFEIDRYARLIEALRRLPPMMKEIEVEILPDSLLYRNDSLDVHLSDSISSLEKEVIRIAFKDSVSAPFVLDSIGESLRDSCIFFASEILKMNADNRATVIADSTHYQEAYLRIKETYDYAETCYRELEKYVFIDGQTPFLEILANPHYYWDKTQADLQEQYSMDELQAGLEAVHTDDDNDTSFLQTLSSKAENALLVFVCVMQIVVLVFFWILSLLGLWLLCRYTRVRNYVPKKKMPIVSILTGTILYFLVFGFSLYGDEYIELGVKHVNTFLWLLVAISGSLLLRVKPEQFRQGFRLYSATFLIVLVIIACRVTFMPDRLMVLLFPPILFLIVVWQLFCCIWAGATATSIDRLLGWASLAIYLVAFVFAFLGYTFVVLLILVGWYFLLAVWLTVVCFLDLMDRYKQRWLNKRVDDMRARITYVTGEERESLLMGATWFYDLIRQVAIPAILLLSLPMCVHLSLGIFDFDDLFVKFYENPFIQLFDKNGFETLRVSGRSIVYLLILYYVLCYFNRAIHAIWQYAHYMAFMRKHNRTSIRPNEINLSLGNSIIRVLVWTFYAVVVISVWQIPTGSLGLVAGGLSAGIGLALKDVLNNFIYGIQLMGGRLRVGDWIECDGVRGKVTAINYQCVQVETIEGTEMSFLNSSLFGKNFNNLTRNHSYELTTITVGVAYGTEVNRVREVLKEAMQKMRTKDRYGREIVDPKYGFHVVVGNMSDSAVDINVKQYVLVAERINYVDHAKEVIYDALNAAGIVIPFPQCDVHLIPEEKETC